MKKIIATRGLPASGKSSWAKKFVNERQNWILISNDSIRESFFARIFSKQDTKNVDKIRNLMIEYAIDNNFNIVVDNTNLNPKRIEELQKVAESNGYSFDIKDFTDVPIEECIRRDKLRSKKVSHRVILNMYNYYLNPDNSKILTIDDLDLNKINNKAPHVINENTLGLPQAIICDLDGTLALMCDRSPYDASKCDLDTLNKPVYNCVNSMQNAGYKIIFVSGREDKYREPTEKFLSNANIQDYLLYMRETNDVRKDSIVKEEIYNNKIKDNYFIDFVLDDRLQVVKKWRELGLWCFQVDEGNF